jgi:hypothetical protein
MSEHVLTQHDRLASTGFERTGEHPDGGRFATPVGAKESEDLPARHVEVDFVNRREVSEAFRQPAHRNGCSTIRWSSYERSSDTHRLLRQPPASGQYRNSEDHHCEERQHQ